MDLLLRALDAQSWVQTFGSQKPAPRSDGWFTNSRTQAAKGLRPSSGFCGCMLYNYIHPDTTTRWQTQIKEDVKAIRNRIEFKLCVRILSWQWTLGCLWIVFLNSSNPRNEHFKSDENKMYSTILTLAGHWLPISQNREHSLCRAKGYNLVKPIRFLFSFPSNLCPQHWLWGR